MIKRVLLVLALSLGGAWLVRMFLCEAIVIVSGSMEPTLPIGNHYLVNKCIYHMHPPLRGDIVMLKSPVDAHKGLVKRVIAVAGDRIEMHSKQVYLNGDVLSEPYAIYKRPTEHLVGDNIPSLTVPGGAVFVLGDNRDESEDSSVWKNPKTGEPIYFVSDENIEGRLMRP